MIVMMGLQPELQEKSVTLFGLISKLSLQHNKSYWENQLMQDAVESTDNFYSV